MRTLTIVANACFIHCICHAASCHQSLHGRLLICTSVLFRTGSLIGAHGYCYSAAWFLLYYTMSGPCVSLLFGVYLFTCVTFMGAHWDTGYSSLQIEHYKSFVRLHLKPSGDLEV